MNKIKKKKRVENEVTGGTERNETPRNGTEKNAKFMELHLTSYSRSGDSCLRSEEKEMAWCSALKCSSCAFMGPDMFNMKDVLIRCWHLGREDPGKLCVVGGGCEKEKRRGEEEDEVGGCPPGKPAAQ